MLWYVGGGGGATMGYTGVIIVAEGTACGYQGTENAAAGSECDCTAGCLAEGTRHTLGQASSMMTAVGCLQGKDGSARVVVLSYSSPAQRNIIPAGGKHLKGMPYGLVPALQVLATCGNDDVLSW